MTRHRMCLIVFAIFISNLTSAHGAEPFEEFLRGLKERGYYDSALFYLEQQEQLSSLPADVKITIPYNKALVLLDGSRSERDPQKQREDLAKAEQFLNQFVQKNPQHPLAANANTERAKIFLQRANVDAYEANSPSNRDRKDQLRKSSLANVAKTRTIFKSALGLYKKTYDAFPTFINQQQNKTQFEARQQAEQNYIRAQLELAMTTYQEAQAHDDDSKPYKDILTKAAAEFEDIHNKYRSMIIGLHAQMMQGKCYQEQKEIGRAMGIYNQLLGHPGTDAFLNQLQDQVRQFRLICLNERKDYQLVVDEASEWFAANRRARSLLSLGIRWERAQALKSLSEKRGLPKRDMEDLLRRARADSEEINKYGGKYKDVSTFLIQEINVALKTDKGDPKDFGTAFSISRRNVKQIADLKDALARAREQKKSAAEIDKLNTEFKEHLRETGRMLGIALSNTNKKDSPQQINQARYYLSYIYLLQQRAYEAAILGEFVGTHFQEQNAQLAIDSAYMALAAYQQAYSATPKNQRDVEMAGMDRLGSLIINTWPEIEKANDARMLLGGVYRQRSLPIQASKFFSQVPVSSKRYVDAQLASGQAYWAAYIDVAPLEDQQWQDYLKKSNLLDPAQTAPDKDTLLTQWRATSEKFLRSGITFQEKTFAGSPPTSADLEDLVAAKVSLGYIMVNKGSYPEIITILTGQPTDPKAKKNPYNVLSAVTVKDEKQRPKTGIKNRTFASSVYQLLLRAYVGTQQIDKALAVMVTLESIASGSDNDNVTAIYVQLGQELQREIERLKGLKQQKRLAEVRSSFDQFLGKLFERKAKMPYNQLIWIAETYNGLGRGIGSENKTVANTYFKRAAESYQAILERGQQDAAFIDNSRKKGVVLRLVNCKRHQGDFENALKLVKELLAENATALQAQFEAAYVLQDWGSSGEGDTHKYLLEAIQGEKDNKKKGIWGWGFTALRLQRAMSQGQLSPEKKAEYQGKFLEARYNISDSRRHYGLAQSSSDEKELALKSAKQEIETMVRISSNVSDDWKEKFNTMYREIQKELGTFNIVDISWPVDFAEPKQAVAATGTKKRPSKKSTKVAAKKAKSAAEKSSGSGMIVGIVMGIACLGGFGWFMYVQMNQSKKRRPAYVSGSMSETPTFPVTAGKTRTASAGAQKRKSAKPSAGSQKRTQQPAPPGAPRKAPPKRRPPDPQS